MKTNRLYQIFALAWSMLASVAFTGCVDDVVIPNLSGENQKLVLYARLCPQLDSTYILLSNTQLLYSGSGGGTIQVLNDGVVELSDDGSHWVPAHFDPARNRYLITREEFPVEEGRTYFIRASHERFAEISATCTVPVSHDVGFRFDTVTTNGDTHWGEVYNWPHKDVYAEWRDVPGEENYYGMKAYAWWSSYTHYPDGTETVDHFWALSPVWLTEGNRDVEYVSDEGHDGEVMRYLFEVDLDEYPYDDDYEWKGGGEGGDEEHPTKYYLLFLDKGSYLYETTLSEDNELNFLMLEPPHTYTNIENGFGLFGGFSMVRVK